MNPLAESLALASINDDAVALIAVGGGITIAIISIVSCAIKSTLKTRACEQTKREVAAYIAEGTMSPEDGERILRSDMPAWAKGEGAWKCKS